MIVNEGSSLTIVNEGLSLSYILEKVVGELKLLVLFLKNYSMISTDALQVGFLSPPLLVNDR